MNNSVDPSQNPKLSEGEFLRLFLKNEPILRAFARSILPDWNSVDDALQEASVTMWEKLGQLRNEEGFLPWAKVILRFKCLSAIDRVRRDRHVLSDRVLELIADEAEQMDADEVIAVRRALDVCLTQFSSPHQELLLAPYAGEGRVKQLAEQDSRTVNALYKLLGRLRAKLATCIRGQLGPEMA
jgi:RNA polymerase sigma-70 factor (ECF subfamily)